MGERSLKTKLESDSDRFFLHRSVAYATCMYFHSAFITDPGSLMLLSNADCVTRGFRRRPNTWAWGENCVRRKYQKNVWVEPGPRRPHPWTPVGINQKLISWLLEEANAKRARRCTPAWRRDHPELIVWLVWRMHREATPPSLGKCMLFIHWSSNKWWLPISPAPSPSPSLLCSAFQSGPQRLYNPVCLRAFIYAVHTFRNSSSLPR